MSNKILEQIADGRTDLVFDYVAAGHAATSADTDGVSLLQWCSYHGDVSAMKFLVDHGESLQSLGSTTTSARPLSTDIRVYASI